MLDSDVSSRVISVKKKGGKDVIGILVFLDPDTIAKLEDIASVVGSIDGAVDKAIRVIHSNIFGEETPELGEASFDDRYIDRIVDKIESKITQLISSVTIRSAQPLRAKNYDRELEIPELSEVEGGAQGEEPALEDVIEDIAVVEFDSSLIESGRKEVSGNENREEE